MRGFPVDSKTLPIVFCNKYNSKFNSVQSNYPYDTQKGQNVLNILLKKKLFKESVLTEPLEITESELKEAHSDQYLYSLRFSEVVSRIAEIPLLFFFPNELIQEGYLRSQRYQTGGTLEAAKLAARVGWAINLGGGYSHCSHSEGGSFSPYADISIAVKYLLANENVISKVLILDLSARQGIGLARDFMHQENIYIMDMFNYTIGIDEEIRATIGRPVELLANTEDEVYMKKLKTNMNTAFNEFSPDIIVYIAGSDIIEGDPLGGLAISAYGLKQRDECVFEKAANLDIPVLMLLGVGFVPTAAPAIANSIFNLKQKGYLPSKHWNE